MPSKWYDGLHGQVQTLDHDFDQSDHDEDAEGEADEQTKEHETGTFKILIFD